CVRSAHFCALFSVPGFVYSDGSTGPRRPFTPRLRRRISMLGRKLVLTFALVLSSFSLPTKPSLGAQQKPSFTVGWSVYVGWVPYYYMAKSGILKKWADKYGIDIKVQRFDYAPSLDAFVAKNIDACVMTNMEALDMPAAAGVDTTAIIVGDYSN